MTLDALKWRRYDDLDDVHLAFRLGLNVIFSNIAIFSVHAQQGNDQIYVSGTSVQVCRSWISTSFVKEMAS
jgi:hypothetical protein